MIKQRQGMDREAAQGLAEAGQSVDFSLTRMDGHVHTHPLAGPLTGLTVAVQGPVLAWMAGLDRFWSLMAVAVFLGLGASAWLYFRFGPPRFMARMILCMLGLGGLGMLVGWIGDTGWRAPATASMHACCMVEGPLLSMEMFINGMYGGMVFASLPCLVLVRHGCEENCPLMKSPHGELKHALLCFAGMIAGMYLGGLAVGPLMGGGPAGMVLVHYAGMMGGMAAGMAVSCRFWLWTQARFNRLFAAQGPSEGPA